MEIRVCKWLSVEEFRELLSFTRYLGRQEGCSVFAIDYRKLEELLVSGVKGDSIIEIIERVTESSSEATRIAILINEIIDKNKILVGFNERGFKICSRMRLSDLLARYRTMGHIRYDKSSRCFIVAPYLIGRIVRDFSEEGIKVEDTSGLVLFQKKLLGEFDLRAKLRPYQEEAIKQWISNAYRGVISLPTGAGKTIVGIAAIHVLKMPTLIVVYTREQLHQWRDMIKRYTTIPSWALQLFYGEEKSIGLVTITTYQTAYRYTGLLSKRFSLLIVDEVHHLPADKFRKIALEVLAPYRLGLSATPYREDGKHVELFRFMGGLVYSVSQRELAEQGYLARFRIIPVFVRLSKREYSEYKKHYSLFSRVARSAEDFDSIIKMASRGVKEAKEALSALNKLRRLLLLSENKLKKLKEIVEEELAKDSKIIIFASYVDVAERVASLLGAYLLTGKTPSEKRKIVVKLFKERGRGVLVTTSVGDEGLDIPDANVGIMLGVMGSKRQFIQRLGRLLRPKEEEARLYIMAVKNTFEERQLQRKLGTILEYFE